MQEKLQPENNGMTQNVPKVLYVDNQLEASLLLKRQLSREFTCTAVASASEAIAAMDASGPYAVVVTDYAMPDMNGVEFLRSIKQRWPATIGVLITATAEFDVAVAALQDGNVYRFVRKPTQPEEIIATVREAAAYYQLMANEQMLREQLARTNAELDEKVQDLDEANELLEYWVEFSPAVLYSISCEHGVLHPSYTSKNFYRLTGFERTAAVIDVNFWNDLLHTDDRPHYRATLADLIDAENSHAVLEYRVRHRAGNYLVIVDSMRAVRDGDGETIEIVGAWMDVTARN